LFSRKPKKLSNTQPASRRANVARGLLTDTAIVELQRAKKALAEMETSTAIDFLKQLRPNGPWTLTAIKPDGAALTRTFEDEDEAAQFIAKYNGERNLYYSVNPTRAGLTKKASKADITAAEFVHADLDPRDDETPDAAKKRYLDELETFAPHYTLAVNSGNGIQAAWKLTSALGPQRFKEVEDLSLAITLKLGGTAGTQNIDRILRLPGTINLPGKKKIKVGRVACASVCSPKLLRASLPICDAHRRRAVLPLCMPVLSKGAGGSKMFFHR
jgi:hypothetical protein